ncbi:methyl-accepting chemotaxis protein, partial [Methylobacterium trifolii]
MNIGKKLIGFVGACSLVTLVVAGVSIGTLDTFNGAVTDVKLAATRALHAANFNRLATEVVMDSRGVYAAADRAEAGKYAERMHKGLAAMDDLLKVWAPLMRPQDQATFKGVVEGAAAFREMRIAIARAGTEVSPKAAAELGFNDANQVNRRAFQGAIDGQVARARADAEAIDLWTDELYRQRMILLLALALGGSLACLLIGGLVGHRQIARPLRDVSGAIRRLAQGEHDLPAVRPSRDEIG